MLNIRFRKSTNRYKKYDAILSDGRIIPFGSIKRSGEPYAQYHDSTGLNLYSDYDHKDKKRRYAYFKRHKIDYPAYSADWFSKMFLWT